MKRRPKLHLVGQEPADIFQDLDQLRAGLATPAQRRKLLVETFARIPHNKALALKISGHAWLVLIELDRIILKSRGRNPVRFGARAYAVPSFTLKPALVRCGNWNGRE